MIDFTFIKAAFVADDLNQGLAHEMADPHNNKTKFKTGWCEYEMLVKCTGEIPVQLFLF